MSRQSWSEFQPVRSVRTANTVLCVFLLMVGLMTVLSPRPVLAQAEAIDLTLTVVYGPNYSRLEAGKDNILFLEIRNTGNKPITDIRLSSVKPEGWAIDFKPAKIDSLVPGSLQTIEVNVKPPKEAAGRRYYLTIVAETNEFRREQNTWGRVERPKGRWLWIGVIVLLVVVAGFAIVFVRIGRR